ncbi:bifunctional histidinol-phosphatase/imidazoleglycerol-phosphate dehydratase HisB [Neolewinella lacunae]|uniref:Histidine biosynthesis bifunctional protein HisB n=1 Tax=Neolewinella lacunae TaxID=1517758 RepID=A0A923PK99_9BACT|nr:bifunctional histidinol-phosphatase/imidazoleglycerol-phosphate dehydratase HisB [Neolewinella lacunae]MBC6995642.1 bifunctional histidinol-phosphatase/imidazoleglycerol-phosphate dehydratase HisB [Neolewinella lacunae]MDN3634291.1 bifunctional histidinol-phosphatase/imidazoleglycerol-phosphate dehydratase HisB [Neolewinella lacunae]
MKKILFLDRDGTLILEPADYQVDHIDKLNFFPGVFRWLGRIVRELDYTLVLVTNQDGLGTASYPEASFWPTHNAMLRALEAEGITFAEQIIDRTFAADQQPTRKPGTKLLEHYLNGDYDLANSYVIGDRLTDIQLAKNLGTKAIWIDTDPELGAEELINEKIASEEPVQTGHALSPNAPNAPQAPNPAEQLKTTIALRTTEWADIYHHLRLASRTATIHRKTNETDIRIDLDLDGTGKTNIHTGLGFFDHMLDQLGRHSGCDLSVAVQGDLHIDEHHTIEDTAIALGEAFAQALGDKLGIERYGFNLVMDEATVDVRLDFGGRPWLVWDANFRREKIGDVPTEMFHHFFKSFTDGARCNLAIKVSGQNEHHMIEATFKALAKSIKMAKRRDVDNMRLPSTKGML